MEVIEMFQNVICYIASVYIFMILKRYCLWAMETVNKAPVIYSEYNDREKQ